MQDSLLTILESSGFTNKEALVYLALLELGAGDVTDISLKSGLKRSIIYVIMEGLIKRGYAIELPQQKVNTYQATDPSLVLSRLKSVTRNFSEMLPIFRTLRNKGGYKPKITYHESPESLWHEFEQINEFENSISALSYNRVEKLFPKGMKQWLKSLGGAGMSKGRHIISNSKRDLEIGALLIKAGQEVAVLNIADFNTDFAIYGDKLAFASFDRDPYMIVIKSKGLAVSMSAVADLLWSEAKKIKKTSTKI